MMKGPSDATLKMVGDWSKQMDIPIQNALNASIELTGRSGKEACGMALVYMARSASRMTKEAKVRRDVRTGKYGKYVVRYTQGKKAGRTRIDWKWMFKDANTKGRYKKAAAKRGYDQNIRAYHRNRTWDQGKLIPRRKLAKRSWMWGIKGLRDSESIGGRGESSKPIPGVTWREEVIGNAQCGYVLKDSLSYIFKAAPSDVELRAAQQASNNIMAVAARQMERQFGIEVPRLAAQRAKRPKKTMAQAWRGTP
jgi:hypothetical protein